VVAGDGGGHLVFKYLCVREGPCVRVKDSLRVGACVFVFERVVVVMFACFSSGECEVR
jgi:hypothetical protein